VLLERMKRKLQVFVSSTFLDLKAERQAAVEAILLAGHIPAGMELFSAGDESQLEIIKKWIEASDIYMVILGGRYGSIEPNSGLSYIEVEYDHAVARKMPLFALVLDQSVIDERALVDEACIEKAAPELLGKFRQKVLSKISRTVEDPKDVKLHTMASLKDLEQRTELIGWVRANEPVDASPVVERIAASSNSASNLGAYLTAYEAIHYLADESQWGADTDSYMSADGLKRNALIDAPREFQARAAEGRIRAYGASSKTGNHELIPKTHWMSYGLDLSKIYKRDAVCSTTPTTFEAGFHAARGGKHIYSDLKIERADVYQVWPPHKEAEAEFDEAFEWAALSREEAISILWKLRKSGVAIRNEPVSAESLFPQWKAKYEKWRRDVILAAQKVDDNLSYRLEVLDRLRPPPTLPVINEDHARCITIASEILLRLEERLP